MYRRICTATLALLAGACAAGTPAPGTGSVGLPASVVTTSTGAMVRLDTEPVGATAQLDAPPARVWALMPEVYEALGIPAEINDAGARSYGTRRFSQSRVAGKRVAELVRCGHEGAGASAMSAHQIRLSIISSLQPAPDGRTALRTEVAGSAAPVEGTSTRPVRCVSLGEIERRIQTLLVERLGS